MIVAPLLARHDPIRSEAMQEMRTLFGQGLVERGVVTLQQVEDALFKQQTSMGHRRIGEILSRMGAISKSQITEQLSVQLGIPIIKISDHEIPERIRNQIPGNVATLYRVVPLEERGAELVIATADPTNMDSLDRIQSLTERSLNQVLATPEEIALALNKYYGLQD